MILLLNIPISTFRRKLFLEVFLCSFDWLRPVLSLSAGVSALAVQILSLAWPLEFPKLETASFIASMSALLQALQ